MPDDPPDPAPAPAPGPAPVPAPVPARLLVEFAGGPFDGQRMHVNRTARTVYIGGRRVPCYRRTYRRTKDGRVVFEWTE